MRVLALCIVLAAPAWAEVNLDRDKPARADLALISSCFDAARTWEAAQDCVNLTYEACIERLGREANRPDHSGCNRRELTMWELLLADQTRKLEAWTLHKDNEISEATGRDPTAHSAFIGMEADWSAYRKAQCAFVIQQFVGGTIVTTVEPHCQMDLIVDRLFTLRPFLMQIEAEDQP